MRHPRLAVTLVAGALMAGPAAAHHSSAAFDVTTEVTIEGILTRFAYNNPHIYLTVEVTAADGTRRSQEVEAGPISTIQPLGLMRDSLPVGERVVVRANPSRLRPGYTVLGRYVTRADGTTLPLHITSASVRPASTAVATGLAGTWRPTVKSFQDLARAINSSWPLTDDGRKARQPNRTPQADCIPAGAPMLMVYPVATTIAVGDKAVVFEFDWLGATRTVHLDAGAHPPDLQPTLQGHSIGRWEDEALVVETVGFAPHAEGLGFGLPSGERKRLVERFTLGDDRRHLVYEVTVEDPTYLAQPVAFAGMWEYEPDLRASGVPCDVEVARRYLVEAEDGVSAATSANPQARWPLIVATATLLVLVGGLVVKTRRREHSQKPS